MKDLTVILVNKPGTIADAFEALGGAGVNVVGTCGFPAAGEGVGLEVRDERDVVLLDPLPSQAGSGGAVLRRIANQGVNADLAYLTEDGRVVLSGDDVPALERAARS